MEHLDHVHLVLEKLRDVTLKLNPLKCCFLHKEVEYLGHAITSSGLKPNMSKHAIGIVKLSHSCAPVIFVISFHFFLQVVSLKVMNPAMDKATGRNTRCRKINFQQMMEIRLPSASSSRIKLRCRIDLS